MRIRKHAHISPLVNGGSALNPEGKGVIKAPYVCQLNQSPWDVLTFPLSDYLEQDPTQLLPPLPPPPPPPVDGEVSSMENGSISDCPEAENSMNSEKWEEIIDTDKAQEIEFEGNRMLGGRKKIKIKERRSNHQVQVKKQYKLTKKPGKNNNPDSIRHSRVVRAKKQPVSSSNPYEYYYYSGFGPRWGRSRRGAVEPESGSYTNDSLINIGPDEDVVKGDQGESYSSGSLENDNATATTTEVDNPRASPARIHKYNNGLFDYVDNDDDEESEDDIEEFVPRKRARKPIKARSLKSLM